VKKLKMKLLKYILNIIVFIPFLVFGQNNICFGENIEVSTSGYNSSTGFTQNYVLVDNNGNILDYNSTGIFNSSSYGNNYSGNINLYAVNTDDNTLMGTANGSTWNAFENGISENDICARFIGPRSFNIIPNDTTEVTFTSCNSFLWDLNNVTYNNSTIDYVILSNINGCDSVIQLNLTISNESNNTTVEACDSYDWNGNTYTISDTYTNSNGTCEDSLFLTINETYSLATTEQACNSYLWDANNITYTMSGSYVQTLTTTNGCDSILILDLTIIDCEVTPICSGESLTKLANGFNTNNFQYYILSDSITGEIISYNLTGEFTPTDYDENNFRTLTLHALNTNEATLIQTISNASIWTEIENDASSKCADVLGPKYFEIIPCCELAVNSNIIDETCEGKNDGELNLTISGNSTYNVLINSNSFGTNTSPGDYEYSELTPNSYNIEIIDNLYPNCDTSFSFSINPGIEIDSTLIEQSLCTGDSVLFNGNYYGANNPSGFETLTSISGCDSVLVINITVNEIDTTYRYPELCFGDSILINSNYYGANNSSGFEVLTSTFGCDSILAISVTENTEIKTGINKTLCFGEEIEINGVNYNSENLSGSDTLTSIEGCDSILIINVIVEEEIINDDSIQLCVGGSVLINGTTYDASNPSGVETLTSINGCDSIRIIEIKEVDEIINNIEPILCYGESITINNIIYNAANPNGTDTLTASIGCDSVINISVTELDIVNNTLNDTVCFGDSILINGNYYGADNPTGTEILTAINGCDSILTINVYERAKITTNYDETICFGDSVLINGNYYGSDNLSATDTLTAKNGCDSILIINIVEREEIITNISETICYEDSIHINGNTYNYENTSGSEIFTSIFGCDSTINISLNVREPNDTSIIYYLCEEDSLIINGVTYNHDNLYGSDTIQSSNSCDSIINFQIEIFETTETLIFDTICYGDSIEINEVFYSSINSSSSDTLQSLNGCDSIVRVSIFERPENIKIIDSTICFNGDIEINGTVYNSSNPSGIETLSSVFGCDSVIQITINELEDINTSIIDTLCYGDSIVINGITYNANNNSGTEVLTSSYGCDSIINISISEDSQIISFINETICKNDTFYIFNNAYYYGNQVGIVNLTANNGCDSTINISVNVNELPNIHAELVVNFDTVYNLSDGFADSVCDFDTLQFFGQGGEEYIWSNNIIDGNEILFPFDEFYSLSGTDSNGCNNSFEFDIFIDEYCIEFNLDTSNVFTPDGDGVNDVFLMSGKAFETNSLQIYNRWGQIIYENFDGKGWDGRLQSGAKAEPGTYYYMTIIKPITRKPSDLQYIQGYLKLIR
tara:strand:- start:9169 stop:13140 length:3972 start_codon:yes stop_codon:yes gene_type:complete